MSDIMSENNEEKTIGGMPFTAKKPQPFKQDYFHMSINTFGALELYNKKQFTEVGNKEIGYIPRIDGIKSITPLLRITNKNVDTGSSEITDEMKKLFEQYLYFFNFVIALIRNDKRFTGDKNTLIKFLNEVAYPKSPTLEYTSITTIVGQQTKSIVGQQTKQSLQRIANAVWKKSGMLNTNNKWEYCEPNNANTTPPKIIESGYTLIMDMLLAKTKLQSDNANIDIDIDIREVCKLLAFCEKDRTGNSNPELQQRLIDGLITGLTDKAIEAAAKANDATEIYRYFLNTTYADVIKSAGFAVANPVQPRVTGAVDTASVAAVDTAQSDAPAEGEAAAAATDGNGNQSNTTNTPVAADTSQAQEGGQKSKTLKRRQQMKNKSRHKTGRT